tara:strand:+ start:180 stop:851 length:672 start_codon:yes stop_codon:yes gene_type:complete
MRFIRKSKENLLIKTFIKDFKNIAKKRERTNKRFSFVLTGGNSPIKLYKALAKENIKWKNIDFFWGDERLVSKKSKYSNFNLANTNILKKIEVDKKQLYSMDINRSSVLITSKKYSSKIKRYFKNKKIKFDVILLGMGNDGHIASIFQNDLNLKSNKITRPVLREDFKRITLNIKIINNAKNIYLWLNSKKKFDIYKKLILRKKSRTPVSFLNKKKLFVFCIS